MPVYTTENETTYYFSYTVEEAPVVGYDGVVTYDESGSTATATITNTPREFNIVFKYYDRYFDHGTPAGIDSTETEYSVTVNGIPNDFVNRDDSGNAQSVDYAGLIGDKAVEFSQNALAVNNVMCDYDLWTSQSAAVQALNGSNYFYFDDGEHVPYGNSQIYHTDYLGKPQISDEEKWVSYFDSEDTEVTEADANGNEYAKVSKIVVWCYNYPKLYNVDVFGADSEADLDLTAKNVAGNQVYVADDVKSNNNLLNQKFYYNQRFGGKTNNTAQDSAGFIENYGLPGFTGVMPSDVAKESFGEYTFAYWAYDKEGTQIASVEREFWYRVTTDTELYAVYTKGSSSNPGFAISADTNDTYVDESGVSRTRLNIFGSVFGAPKYDTNVQKLAFVNIALSTQIRDNPELYTLNKINALFEQYKTQLKEIIAKYDHDKGSKSFSSAETYNGAIDTITGDVSESL